MVWGFIIVDFLYFFITIISRKLLHWLPSSYYTLIISTRKTTGKMSHNNDSPIIFKRNKAHSPKDVTTQAPSFSALRKPLTPVRK